MDPVRVAIVGSGFMGRSYAECLVKHNRGVRLVAVTGGSRAPGLAADYAVEAVRDFPALLERSDVDAVVIATPHHLHAEQVIAAARKGKHALVEKPMATSVADCDAMIAACKAARVLLSVIKTLRQRTVFSAAKRLIEEGRIGRVSMIQSTSLWTWYHETYGWPSLPESGGDFLDRGVHVLDLMRWLAGDEPVAVYGSVGSVRGSAWRALSGAVQLEFSRGASAQVWISHELPGTTFPGTRYLLRICGEKGLLECDGFGKLQLGTPDGWEVVCEQAPIDPRGQPHAPARLEAFYLQTQDFVDSIRHGRTPSVSAEDGRAAVEMVQAAYLSTLSGAAVRLPLPRAPGGFQFDGATVSRELIPA